jgi:hypothetical protein
MAEDIFGGDTTGSSKGSSEESYFGGYPQTAAIMDLDTGTVDKMMRPLVNNAVLTGQIRDVQDHMDMGAYIRDFDKIKERVKFLQSVGDPDELKMKVPALRGCKTKTEEEVEEMSRKQKKETETLLIGIIMLHVIGYLAYEILEWTWLWRVETRFWLGIVRVADSILNKSVVYLPGHIPLIFPFRGTFGLFIGTWLLAVFWSVWRILGEKLGGFAGFYYIMDDKMQPVGKFFAAGATFTGTTMVDDAIMCNISTPAESINEPRIFAVWKMLKSWFPFYLGNQIRTDKYVIYATRDMFFPVENYAQQHNQILGELFETGFYYTSGPQVYKIYTCDKVVAWNRIPPGAYPRITHQAMSAYKGLSIKYRIMEKNVDLIHAQMEMLLKSKHVIDRQMIKLMADRLSQMTLMDKGTQQIRAKYGGYWDNMGERRNLAQGWDSLRDARNKLQEEQRVGGSPSGRVPLK